MIQIDLATLVKRLNPFAKQALEMAASECMSQQASEITVAHVLLQMLAIPRNGNRRHPACPLRQKHDRRRP